MTKAKTKDDSGVKISNLKHGDIVLIKMRYVCDGLDESYGEYPHFSTDDDSQTVDPEYLEDSDIHSILESPIRVGDKVRIPHSNLEWEIRALIDGKAWLWFDHTTCSDFVNNLTKVS